MSKRDIKKMTTGQLKHARWKTYKKLKGMKADIGFDERYNGKSHMFTEKKFKKEELQNEVIEIDTEINSRCDNGRH